MIAAFITLSKFLQRKARAKPKKTELQAPGRPKIQQKNAALAALRLPAPDGHGHRTPGPQACKPGWLRWTRRALPESVPHGPGRPADGPCLLRAQLFCAMRLRRSSAGFFLPVNPSVIADSARSIFVLIDIDRAARRPHKHRQFRLLCMLLVDVDRAAHRPHEPR